MMFLLLGRALDAAVRLSRRYRRGALDLVKIHATIYYVRGVQAARKASRAGLLALGLTALIGAGFVILPIGLATVIYGLSGSWVAAGCVLLALGGVYVILPLFVYRRCMSERAWMSLFKAHELVARVTDKTATG